MEYEQLHPSLEHETQLFCQAELAIQAFRSVPSTRYYHEDDPARTTNCGIATGSIQKELQEYHKLEASRMISKPDLIPKTRFGRRFSHVILQHDTFVLDPTYGQLFEYSGLDRHNQDTARADYPNTLSLVVDVNNPDDTLEPLAESLEEATYLEHAQISKFAPFQNIGKRAILAYLRRLYNPENYTPFEVTTELPSYDSIQGVIRMTEEIRKK